MRAVCLLALLCPAACLNVRDVNDARPRYAQVGPNKDLEVVWQRPNGPPVGVFLWLHGCGNRALDMWSTKGHDGWEFKACNNTKKGYCAGLPQEGLLKSTARKRGYLVMAVQGGVSSNRGCFHPEDITNIKIGIHHVYTVEKLGEMPMIMAGMSAGGRTIGELAGSPGGAGVPMKCAAIIAAELNKKAIWHFPKDLPIGFWHMKKDGATEKLIQENLKNLKTAKCTYKDIEVNAAPIDEDFLMAGGHGLKKETASRVLKALNAAQLLNDKGNLKQDPYNPKPVTRWMKAIEGWEAGKLKEEVGGFAQQSTMTKLMERSWASHALTGDKTDDIIDFCEKKQK